MRKIFQNKFFKKSQSILTRIIYEVLQFINDFFSIPRIVKVSWYLATRIALPPLAPDSKSGSVVPQRTAYAKRESVSMAVFTL